MRISDWSSDVCSSDLADPTLGRDAAHLFNYMTGYAKPDRYEKLVTSPRGIRLKLIQLIDEEIAHAEAGRPAAIWAKMNSLVDAEIGRASCRESVCQYV